MTPGVVDRSALRGNPGRTPEDAAAANSPYPLSSLAAPIGLALCASLALETGRIPWAPAAPLLEIPLSLVALGLLAAWRFGPASWFGSTGGTSAREGSWVGSGLIAAVCAVPLLVELAMRVFLERGQAPELFLLATVRNGALAAALLSHWFEARRASACLSLFLFVLAATLHDGPGLWIAGVLFTLAGLSWLMDAYWLGMQAEHSGVVADRSATRLPASAMVAVVVAVALIAVVVVLAARSAPDTTAALAGFMPTSGGNSSHDPYAREGVNDGDHLVAARDTADTVGPVDAELFLPGCEQSLYDVVLETAGEPTTKKTERSMALTQLDTPPSSDHWKQMQRAGREFSAIRRGAAPKDPNRGDRRSDALLLVKGRAPLHLRLEAHVLFDGRRWIPAEHRGDKSRPHLRQQEGEPWVQIAWRGITPFFGGVERHQVRVIHLKSNRIPSPDQLRAVHIKQVDRADLFQITRDGLLEMDRDAIPPLTSIHLRSEVVDPQLLAERDFHEITVNRHEEHLSLPLTARREELARLAKEWTRGLPRGWPQIAAVLDRLRTEHQLDRQAVPPADCDDAVAHFLLESRAGPDYLFASAAAIVLRHAGYPTRLASGFYADPADYDPSSDTTTVGADDLHFWVEVLADRRTWVAIEPTPGYELLAPAPRWTDRLAVSFGMLVSTVVDGVQHHLLASIGAALLLAAAVAWRVRLLDAILLPICWTLARGGLRETIRATLWLCETRSSFAGAARSSSTTLGRWRRDLAAVAEGESRRAWLAFGELADWALYAPESSAPPCSPAEATQRCLAVQRLWTTEAFAAPQRRTSDASPHTLPSPASGDFPNSLTTNRPLAPEPL